MYAVFSVKEFFIKHKKFFVVGGAILFIFIVSAVLLRETLKESKTGYGICVFKSTPISASNPVDSKIREFGLKIDKINIIAPVIKDVDGSNKTAYEKALKGGVAHFEGTGLPGEKNNIFIFGHSSAEVKSDYSKIFVSLNDLEKGDGITVYYQNNEHKYKVTQKKIIEATDTSVLAKGKKELLTLMTCWPIGTKEKRLIVKAEPS